MSIWEVGTEASAPIPLTASRFYAYESFSNAMKYIPFSAFGS